MIIKIKKSQVKSVFKSVFILFLLTFLMAFFIYAVSTTLTPTDNYVDDDGYLELMGTCTPTTYYVDNSYNITHAILWSNVDGTWKANVTILGDGTPNATYHFNFTNNINQSAEGEYEWNVQCFEENASDYSTNSSAGNNTIIVRYATPTVTTLSPEDNTYDLDGSDIEINCSATPSSGWNLTQIEFMTNRNDVWKTNKTFIITSNSHLETQRKFSYSSGTNGSVADGTDLIFGCLVTQKINKSRLVVTSKKSSINRTINIEYPPAITLNNPANNNWSKNKRVNVSFVVNSTHGSNIAPFPCQIWTNETGAWTTKTGTINVINNTYEDQYVDFLEKTAIQWGLKCQDGNDGNVWNMSVNRTINIDTINPTITGITPATNNTYSDSTVTIIFTPTDTNLNVTKIYFNNFTHTNFTNASPISGEAITYSFSAEIEGHYNFSILANDTSGRTYQTSNYTIIIDTTAPNISNFLNYSVTGYCDKRNLTWDTDESTNYTIYFDTDTDVSDGNISTRSSYTTNHSVIFDFDYNGERLYYFNITSCDAAGNCNTSNQRTFTTPARVCAGWSQYAIYDSLINLSDMQNQSGADLVYFWNATDQTWVYFTAGLTSNGHVSIGRSTDYHVVHLYENTNSTWFRYTTNAGTYNYNVSSIHNFISIPRVYNFGNLTDSLMNMSKEYPSYIGNTSQNSLGQTKFGPFNITYFAGYNNSAQDYVSHIYNFTWANATFLEPCPLRNYPITCMETAWVASGFNVSWNGTAVYANWTI